MEYPQLEPYSSEKQFHVKRMRRICLRDVELITSAVSSASAIFHEEDGRKDFVAFSAVLFSTEYIRNRVQNGR